jgi:hypothetical protein
MHIGGVKASTIFFLPIHIPLMKRLLLETHGKEGEFTFKMAVLGKEIMDLEHKV